MHEAGLGAMSHEQGIAACMTLWADRNKAGGSAVAKDMGEMMAMPMPAADEAQAAFMSRCVDHMLNCSDGMSRAAATAHCAVSWDNRPTMSAPGAAAGRSVANAKTIVRKTTAAAPPTGNPLEYVMSDASVDRMGDIIDPAGWKLDNFRRNPIALFGHNSGFPIGRWKNVRVEGGRLLGELEPAKAGTSARVDEINSLIKQGILRATSVGFNPIKREPLDPKDPYGGQRYLQQDLLETSIVSVPANPAAIQLAKSLRISDETMSLAFGEQAAMRRRDMATIGEQAALIASNRMRSLAGVPVVSKATPMLISKQIEDVQEQLNAARDAVANHYASTDADPTEGDALSAQVETLEVKLAALERAERATAGRVQAQLPAAPATNRRPLGFPQTEVKGFDLLVRAMTVRGISHFGQKTIDQVLDERYPGHEATAIVTKADQTIGTTTVSGWASQIVSSVNQGFLEALMPFSMYPALRSRGIAVNVDGIGSVILPARTAGGAGGGFVAEGTPIRVGRITTTSVTLLPKKMGVIVPFSRELARRSTPAIESIVRNAILEDTGAILDAAIIDTGALSALRPAGLLNGLSAAASGYGGGDAQAVIADFKALLAPFYAANAADNITVLMNPAQGLSMSMMPGPGAAGDLGWTGALTSRLNILESTSVPAGRLIALRNSDFATAMGDAPEIDISEQATVHMEDTTPLEIVSGTGPTTADPVRSFFQTATIGVRMLMDVTWIMRRTGMVQWIDGTSW